MNPWIVCHRQFDHGIVGLYAFTSEKRAYLHAARLILAELEVLYGMDDEHGPQLATELHNGNYEEAVRLYHCIDGNPDCIDVACLPLDHFHEDEPLKVPTFS